VAVERLLHEPKKNPSANECPRKKVVMCKKKGDREGTLFFFFFFSIVVFSLSLFRRHRSVGRRRRLPFFLTTTEKEKIPLLLQSLPTLTFENCLSFLTLSFIHYFFSSLFLHHRLTNKFFALFLSFSVLLQTE
jgi:hypothetical protein